MGWKDDKDLGSWSFKKSWVIKKNLGAWDFKETGADNRYSEGNLIADSDNHVWDIAHTGVPITNMHAPCGYWLNRPVDIYDYLTSMPYPVEVNESVCSRGALIRKSRFYLANYYIAENLDSNGAEIIDSTWKTFITHYYTNWPVESLDSNGAEIIASTFQTFISHYYTDWPVEAIDSSGSDIIAGTLRDAVIRYENWPVEAVDSNGSTIIAGTLT